jgi:hypothetical protein
MISFAYVNFRGVGAVNKFRLPYSWPEHFVRLWQICACNETPELKRMLMSPYGARKAPDDSPE